MSTASTTGHTVDIYAILNIFPVIFNLLRLKVFNLAIYALGAVEWKDIRVTDFTP